MYTRGFRAVDNSMSGSQISTGTYVIIEEATPQNGDIVVALVPDSNTLLIRTYTTANDEISLIPDNANFHAQTYKAGDVKIIGGVAQLVIDIKRK